MKTMVMEQNDLYKTSNILPEINELNFDRIKYKLSFSEKKTEWSAAEIDLAEIEYKRYLTLIKLNMNLSIVPSKMMDEFWHMHILDTKAYREDCQKVFGMFIDHFPYFGIYGEHDHNDLMESFEKTKKLYHDYFNMDLPEDLASRCQDHPCHVPSECACRVPGACKKA